MLKIYHNPRCSKSRQALAVLEASEKPYQIIKYLEDTPTKEQLKVILKKLDMQPIELIRRNEAIWKENFKDKELSDSELLEAMVTHPKLIERPIIIDEKSAVIGRPTEQVHTFIA